MGLRVVAVVTLMCLAVSLGTGSWLSLTDKSYRV